MFTGIVEGLGLITEIIDQEGLRTIKLALPEKASLEPLKIGTSLAVNGVCLTVTDTAFTNTELAVSTVSLSDGKPKVVASFDIMGESLAVTNLSSLSVGQLVNIERSARYGQEIGGHPLSGHIDTQATVVTIEHPDSNNTLLTFAFESKWLPYIFQKGYIAIDGVSLTVSNLNRINGTFQVWLIPETLRVTTFGTCKTGDRVNIEIDRQTQVVVDTVRAFLNTVSLEELGLE